MITLSRIRPRQINFMDDGFAALILPWWKFLIKKKNILPLHFFASTNVFFFFFYFAAPLCLKTPFFSPACYVFFFEKKYILFRSPHFCGKSFFWKKQFLLLRSLRFGRKSKFFFRKNKTNNSLTRSIFSAENTSPIKLIWCGNIKLFALHVSPG